jgi:hypothetical protein
MTPYGPLVDELRLQLDDNTHHCIPCFNPFAMIFYVCLSSHCAARFLISNLASQVNRICFYHDGVVPGNQLRPDNSRAFEVLGMDLQTYGQIYFVRLLIFFWRSACYCESPKLGRDFVTCGAAVNSNTLCIPGQHN